MNDLNKTIRRSTQYWFEDGLVELLMGILFAVIGLLFWWQTTAASFESAVVGAIALPAIIIVGALLLGATLAATLALGLIGLGLIVSGGFVFWRYWQNSAPGNEDPAEALS